VLVFVSEHVDPSQVGVACGILTAGLTGGILLGSLVATTLSTGMTHDQLATYGWRIPFLLGGAFGLLSMHLRRLLAETLVFLELEARRTSKHNLKSHKFGSPSLRPTTLRWRATLHFASAATARSASSSKTWIYLLCL